MNNFNDQMLPLLFVFPVVIILILFIMFRGAKKGRKRPQQEQTEVSFVVDTFHELVARLKKKERELEVLRKEAEERAEDIESYSDNIIQSVPSGVISLDNSLVITKANHAAFKILRLREQDMIGRSGEEVFRSPLSDIIGKKKALKRGEYRYELPSGEKIWLGLTTSPLYNKHDELIGQIIIFSDLTELKMLEKQIRFREWLSSLGEISLGIAHELRNPLAVISGYLRILQRKVSPPLPEIDSMVKEIKLMDRIMENFLTFARPVTPNLTDIDLRDLIEDLLRNQIRGDIEVNIHLDECTVRGDEVLLRQSFSNLFQNAREAMPGGGTLKIRMYRRSSSVVIEIADTGKGIPEEIREKIFLPFYTTRDKGTGLGLSLVQKNITLMAGSITASSSPEGAVFTVELPANGN